MSPTPRELHFFTILTAEEKAAAVRRMASQGWSDHGIAAATRLSVEQVRRIVAERQAITDPQAQQ